MRLLAQTAGFTTTGFIVGLAVTLRRNLSWRFWEWLLNYREIQGDELVAQIGNIFPPQHAIGGRLVQRIQVERVRLPPGDSASEESTSS